MDGEGERGVVCRDVFRPNQPARGHDELGLFENGVEAEGGFQFLF